jgi:hypothetical protein
VSKRARAASEERCNVTRATRAEPRGERVNASHDDGAPAPCPRGAAALEDAGSWTRETDYACVFVRLELPVIAKLNTLRRAWGVDESDAIERLINDATKERMRR